MTKENLISNNSETINNRQIELEKAYFDSITPKFNINDKYVNEQVFKTIQEKMTTYIQERYGNYINELLEQYGYGQENNNRRR